MFIKFPVCVCIVIKTWSRLRASKTATVLGGTTQRVVTSHSSPSLGTAWGMAIAQELGNRAAKYLLPP